MGDTQSKFAYLKRLAPADRKIKQRDFENRLGLAHGTLSDEFLTNPTGVHAAPVVEVAAPKATAKPKKKKAPKKKAE